MDGEEKKLTNTEGEDTTTSGSTEEVNNDFKENEEGQEAQLEQGDSTEGAQADTIPTATFLDLKRKYKAIKKERDFLRVKSLDNESIAFIEEKKQKYLKMGYNEDIATELANDLAEVRGLVAKNSKNDITNSIIEDIEDLSSDPYYRDAKEYENEIIQKVSEAKRKGYDLDVEDAFLMVSKHKKRTKYKEQKVNDEQVEIIERKQNRSTTSSNVATSSSSNIKPKFNLDAHDKKALAELQKVQPDAKWTPEKYYNVMVKERN